MNRNELKTHIYKTLDVSPTAEQKKEIDSLIAEYYDSVRKQFSMAKRLYKK